MELLYVYEQYIMESTYVFWSNISVPMFRLGNFVYELYNHAILSLNWSVTLN